VALWRHFSSSLGYTPCWRHQALRAASSSGAVVITASRRAAAVQVRMPVGSESASDRQRSSVATPTPNSRETVSTGAPSGGNNRATARSLNSFPYLATWSPLVPPSLQLYRCDNYLDAGGLREGRYKWRRPMRQVAEHLRNSQCRRWSGRRRRIGLQVSISVEPLEALRPIHRSLAFGGGTVFWLVECFGPAAHAVKRPPELA
jgi:hypothetical protein